MEVIEAPEPEDVFWLNTGRSHKDLEIGWLLSMTATATLCLFWTVPIAFVASLNSVNALTQFLPFVGRLVEALPFLAPLLAILAPLLVVLLNALLPTILGVISMLEGPISGATLTASKFSKLAVFSIVQTFFISAITKGAVSVASQITGDVSEIIANPLLLVDLLATELAKNSSYFIQIIFVSTVTQTGLELLRLVPLLFAAIRHYLGPKLTPREKKKPFLGIFQPLRHVFQFSQADILSSIILLYMVLFVYAAIAPIVSFVAAFCFWWIRVTYTNQNLFIYSRMPDSGGKLWPKAIRILLSCMIIAEIVTLGILGLRQSFIAIPLMVPLIVISALFYGYVNQQHFKVAEHLTADACMQAEMKQQGNFDIRALVEGQYIQPAMQRRTAFPELPDTIALPVELRDMESGDDGPKADESGS
jgi:calcium permeable stress-gated cation channel